MAGETVTVSYKVLVENLQSLEEFKRKHQEAQQTIDEMKVKLENASKSHEKHESALLKGRKAIIDFRKELFLLSFTIGSVTGVLVGLGRSSDALGGQLQGAGSAIQKIGKHLGDMVAQTGAVKFLTDALDKLGNKLGEMSGKMQGTSGKKNVASAETLNFMDTYRAKTLSLSGDMEGARALELQLEYLTKIQPQMDKLSGTVRQDLFNAWKSYESASMQALKRSELGLKTNLEIMKDYKRAVAEGFKSGVSDPIFKFLQGEKQSPMDIIKGFTAPLHRALADAIGESLKSQVFGGEGGLGGLFSNFKTALMGENSTSRAVRQNERSTVDNLRQVQTTMQNMQSCICRTAENTGTMIGAIRASSSISGSIEIPGQKGGGGFLGALGGIASAFGGIGKLFSGGMNLVSNLFGSPGNISMGAGAFQTRHSGGEIVRFPPKFATGGEVPAMVQPGEFVVNRAVAQNNKDFLKDFNMHGDTKKSKRGGQNVFLIKANDASSFADQLSTPSGRAQIELQVVRAIMGNGNVRKIIKDFAK